jgi:C-terminal processing protease CtpA/Prc
MPAPGFPLYTVAFIEEGSPSWEAGLRQDDQILKVNGKNTLFMNFEEIIGTLYQKANTKIKLEIQRGEEYKEIHFKLQEPFTFPPLRVSSKRETGSN